MKHTIFISFLTVVIFIIATLGSCKKESTNNNNNNNPVKETVKDIDGNEYNIITIGSQKWFAENLKTTKYNDNSAIPNVSDNNAWVGLSTGAYCWYNNDYPNIGRIYGAIYNWHAVNTDKLCPAGWHVPSEDEWATLSTFLGGDQISGGKLKQAGTTHWNNPNTGASNSSSFSALPGGGRSFNTGNFYGLGEAAYFWSSTSINSTSAYGRDMNYDDEIFNKNSLAKKVNGRYVRCLKNN